MSKVLISGGAGFIGSNLTDKLLSLGHKVIIIDNFITGKLSNLPKHKNLILCRGSITDNDLVNKTFKLKPDIVVHAAASYKNPDNWGEDAMTNVIGTINILNASKNVKRLIYFQTSLCYGLQPIEQPITLNHPLFSGKFAGGSSYAISKTAAEQYIELSGIEFLSFRLANIYGRRNLSGAVPTFYNRIKNGQKCTIMDSRRDMVYIDDLLEVFLKVIEGQGKKGYYNISSGDDYSILGLYYMIKKYLGIDAEMEVRQPGIDDVKTLLIDPTKANIDFNWKTHTPLEEGIKTTIDWYKENKFSETYTHLKIS